MSASDYEGLNTIPVGISPEHCPEYLLNAARKTWDAALDKGERFGFRNAQVTVIAPTGTIGLVMDCDTTGVEPDFALVKFKKLAGGGYFKIINQSVPLALAAWDTPTTQMTAIVNYCKGAGTLEGCPHLNPEKLVEHGFDGDASSVSKALRRVPSTSAWSSIDSHLVISTSSVSSVFLRRRLIERIDFDLLSVRFDEEADR